MEKIPLKNSLRLVYLLQFLATVVKMIKKCQTERVLRVHLMGT